jgi:multiple sugar transport system permease protein
MLEYKNDKWKALLALGPVLLLMVVFTFYPIINTFVTSFMEGYTYGVWYDTDRGVKGWISNFGQYVVENSYDDTGAIYDQTKTYFGLGFNNFISVFKDPLFIASLKNTALMVIISVPVAVIISLLIAVALNGVKKLQGFFQTIYFLPYVTNTIALGLVFSVMFASKSGLVNSGLTAIGLEPVAWLKPLGTDSQPTYWSCMFVLMVYTIWNGLAFKILVFLSGMQSIDKQYYQAAQVDATPRWRVFRRITVPLLSPMIAYITITSFIGAFKAYSSVIALFNGRFGPSNEPDMLITVVGYTYKKLDGMSVRDQLSQASASALILFAIIMLITMVQLWVSKKKVHY